MLAAEEARARGDAAGALHAYERALVDDELMEGERADVALAMGELDPHAGEDGGTATWRRLLARGDLDARTRAVALARLEAAADRLEQGGRLDDAASLHELVLVEGGTTLAGRDRVLARFRRAVEKSARAKLEVLARQPSTLDKLTELAAVRARLHRAGASRGLLEQTSRAMIVTAEAAFAEAERLEESGQHAAALRFADALVAPLPEAPSLAAKRNELAGRVALRFETLVAAAQGFPGAVALRSGWMLRATGRTHPARKAALDDLDRRARAQYSLQIAGNVCTDVARGLGSGFGGARGVVVATRLEVGRCAPTEEETSRREPYTYYVTESYTTTETRYETRSEPDGQDCRTVYGPRGSTSQSCTPRTTTRTYPKTETVTRQRQVPRTGYRTIVTTTFTYELSGAARLAAEERALTHPFSVSGKAVRTVTTGGPEGTRVEGGGPEDAARDAEARAEAALAEGRRRMDAERARAWLDKAARAEGQGKILEAEDAHATAVRALGAVLPETRVFAERKLALEDDVAATLEGAAGPAPATLRLALQGPGDELARARATPHDARARDEEAELPGRASGRFRGAFTFAVAYVEANDLRTVTGEGSPRSGGAASFGLELALASRLVRPLGPTLLDALHGDVAVGPRTGTRAPGDVGVESLLLAGGLGYRVMGGYRSESFGVTAGIDPTARTIQIGDLRTYGVVAPLVVRGEWHLNGPATASLSAWGLSPFAGTRATGAEIAFPLSRHGWQLTVRGEWLALPASVPARAGSAAREATTTPPETRALSLGVGRQL